MKKIVAIIIVFASLVANIKCRDFSLLDYFTGDISYYSLTDNGGADLTFCYKVSSKSGSIIGESVKIENAELNSIISTLRARVIKTEWVEDRCIVYAYSSLVPTSVRLFNENINIQIAYNDSSAIIGWPLIYGDY